MKDMTRNILLGVGVFALIVATGLATALQPVATPGENDYEELSIETLESGSGDEAVEAGDTISISYVGRFKDGTEFDSSAEGEPFQFAVASGQVIPGMDEGVIGMQVGERRLIQIPSDLGYGAEDQGPIPGGSGLEFEVELVEIVDDSAE